MDNLREGTRRWHGLATRSGRELAARRGGSGSGSGISRVAGLGIIMIEFGTEQASMGRRGEAQRESRGGDMRGGGHGRALVVWHYWFSCGIFGFIGWVGAYPLHAEGASS